MMQRKVFLDLETTGLNPVRNGILTIGVIIDINGKRVHSKEIKVKCFKHVDNYALKVNGINLEEHNKIALSEKQAILKLNEYLSGNKFDNVLYCHNAVFDVPFLKRFYEEAIVEFPFSYNSVCTLSLAKALKDVGMIGKYQSLKNEELYKFFGGDVSKLNFHNALDDIRATRHNYYEMLKLIKGVHE